MQFRGQSACKQSHDVLVLALEAVVQTPAEAEQLDAPELGPRDRRHDEVGGEAMGPGEVDDGSVGRAEDLHLLACCGRGVRACEAQPGVAVHRPEVEDLLREAGVAREEADARQFGPLLGDRDGVQAGGRADQQGRLEQPLQALGRVSGRPDGVNGRQSSHHPVLTQ
ncbi:MAG: hypothetical protein Q8L92_07290 [Rubrivivax sp.]|nr:hypothetical protein [Rubrivivax sp.]